MMPRKRTNTERDTEMRRLRTDERLSIVDLAARYGISKQRVQQIVGVTGHMHPRRHS